MSRPRESFSTMHRLRALLRTAGWFVLAAALAGAAVMFSVERFFEVPLFGGAFRFERPWFALLLLVVPAAAILRTGALASQRPRLRMSRAAEVATGGSGLRTKLAELPVALRLTVLTLVAFALMGPQSIHAKDSAEIEGIDIVLVLDLSLSMKAADIRPTRFEATKQVVADFISRRPNDRIGAVVFGRDAYTLLPLTTDHSALVASVEGLDLETIDGRGTAIGNGVATGLNRLRTSHAKSKTLILLTDGSSNAGNISPDEAADFASALDVKIYTVLMGRTDDAPVQTAVDMFGRAIFDRGNHPVDPKLLRGMAKRTGGESFEVSDRSALVRSFHTILNRLEKSEIEDPGRLYGELFPAFLWPALGLLILELVLGLTLLRRWP